MGFKIVLHFRVVLRLSKSLSYVCGRVYICGKIGLRLWAGLRLTALQGLPSCLCRHGCIVYLVNVEMAFPICASNDHLGIVGKHGVE